MTILIEIHLEDNTTDVDLNLRHILVDTIENRGLGDVIEVTSARRTLEVVIENTEDNDNKDKFHDLLNSLGFTNYTIQNILEEEEDDD